MPTPPLEKLLETCHLRGSEMLWVVGSPPLIRMEQGLRALQLPPLTGEDLAKLMAQIRPPRSEEREQNGFITFDVTYGDACFFRTSIFPQASPPFVLLLRMDYPPKITERQ